jgi:hypothetical protein
LAPGHLNVIFHGLFAFVYTDECIEVLIPKFQQQKVCAETPTVGYSLTQGNTYTLTGVSLARSAVRFPRDETAVLENFRVINRGANALFCSIYLPRPPRISTLRKVRTNTNFFQGATAAKIVTKTLPLIHVLTYDFTDDASVRLEDFEVGGHGALSQRRTLNLHVFSETTSSAGPAAHHIPETFHTFRSLVRLFPGVDLALIHDDWISPEVTDLPLGIDADPDQRSLEERRRGGAAPLTNPANNPFPIGYSLVVDNT